MIRPLAADVLAIVQARASSSRLPRKVLLPILGTPMLRHELDRIARARAIHALLVATSVDASDDPIAALCASTGHECFRGSLDDVLDRFYRAASAHAPQLVVRLTADCPLIDPAVIDAVIDLARASGADMAVTDESFPDGLDVEVVRFDVLAQAWAEATRPSDREHVTLFVRRQPERFRIAPLPNDRDRSRLRLTVDEPQDFDLVQRIYQALYPANPAFTTNDVVALLEAHPELTAINRGIERNAGLRRSMAADPPEPAG
jgi:spore coat polysaccharide biosynthesis protein SpsF